MGCLVGGKGGKRKGPSLFPFPSLLAPHPTPGSLGCWVHDLQQVPPHPRLLSSSAWSLSPRWWEEWEGKRYKNVRVGGLSRMRGFHMTTPVLSRPRPPSTVGTPPPPYWSDSNTKDPQSYHLVSGCARGQSGRGSAGA